MSKLEETPPFDVDQETMLGEEVRAKDGTGNGGHLEALAGLEALEVQRDVPGPKRLDGGPIGRQQGRDWRSRQLRSCGRVDRNVCPTVH